MDFFPSNIQDADVDKMEKAEILERTLEVLTRLRHDSIRSSNTFSTRKAMAIRYASGFSSCAEESIRYIQNSRLVPAEVKVQLQNHLRAIARRMETIVQVDNQGFPACSSSSSSTSPEKMTVPGVVRDCSCSSAVDRVEDQTLNDQSDIRGYYIGSPIHSSTPGAHHHLPVPTMTPQFETEQKVMNYIPETYLETSQQTKPADNLCSHMPDINTEVKQKFLDTESELHQLQRYPVEFIRVKQCPHPHGSLSCESSLSQSKSFLSSVNSPSFLQSSPFLHSTPILPDPPVYAYYGYEPYPTIPSSLVQNVQSNNSSSLSSNAVKEPKTPGNALDLCVKRTEDQQISPETMWRPW